MMDLYVLDDDLGICNLVNAVGTRLGYKVTSFSSIKALREGLSRSSPDILVVDGLLPDGNGLLFLKDLVGKGKPSFRLVFLSAFFKDLRSYKELRRLGVDKVIYKPASMATLTAELASITPIEIVDTQLEAISETGEDASFELELANLRKQYCHELPAIADNIESLLHKSGLSPERQKEQLRVIVHRVAGGAATYGLKELAGTASALEGKLDRGDSFRGLNSEWEKLLVLLRSPQQQEMPTFKIPRKSLSHMPRRILLVDDDMVFAEMLKRDLEASGINVSVAHTQEAALELITTQSPDALIVDHDLAFPSGGLPLARSLRSVLSAQIPVIFLTMQEGLSERIHAAEMGTTLFLTKPLTSADLLKSLESHFITDLAGLSILVADDDADVLQYIEKVLAPLGVEVRSTATPDKFWEELEKERPTLAVVDTYMPVYSGFQLCKVIKADPRFQDLPVIFISARGSPADRLAAFQAGSDEYLLKPLVAEEFQARMTSRLKLEKLSRKLSYEDALTGMIGRRAIENILQKLLLQIERENGSAASSRSAQGVMMFDLDNFKSLNDTAGHLTGDAALRRVALGFRQAIRQSDYAGRWGGEEFLVVVHNANPEAFEAIFNRLSSYLERYPIELPDHGTRTLTLSAGATFLQAGDTITEAIRRADHSLYRAKAAGKNRLIINDYGTVRTPTLPASPSIRRLRCVQAPTQE